MNSDKKSVEEVFNEWLMKLKGAWLVDKEENTRESRDWYKNIEAEFKRVMSYRSSNDIGEAEKRGHTAGFNRSRKTEKLEFLDELLEKRLPELKDTPSRNKGFELGWKDYKGYIADIKSRVKEESIY